MPRTARPEAYDVRSLLSHRLLVLSNTLGKGAVRLYAQRFGVPLAEWRLLAALVVNAPASVNALAAALSTDKGWISRTTASLVDKGLAATRPDPSDARSFQIVLTPAGRALHKRILPAALERQRKLLEAFSDKELATLDELLTRLQKQAELLADRMDIKEVA
ncbi:MAG TPA: MarR family winged helix-turn-helix transcriptional regulator [Burkholderiales bacterium]|nr:MarR family winged helix-turn-helix transcriptional regulator [Burkholderiales bacterium]